MADSTYTDDRNLPSCQIQHGIHQPIVFCTLCGKLGRLESRVCVELVKVLIGNKKSAQVRRECASVPPPSGSWECGAAQALNQELAAKMAVACLTRVKFRRVCAASRTEKLT